MKLENKIMNCVSFQQICDISRFPFADIAQTIKWSEENSGKKKRA